MYYFIKRRILFISEEHSCKFSTLTNKQIIFKPLKSIFLNDILELNRCVI